jgi:hypothetical protein
MGNLRISKSSPYTGQYSKEGRGYRIIFLLREGYKPASQYLRAQIFRCYSLIIPPMWLADLGMGT